MTGTNSPNYYNTSVLLAGVFHERLIFVVFRVHYAVFDTPRRVVWLTGTWFLCVVWLVVSVVDSGRETPGPIPNPEAKPASR